MTQQTFPADSISQVLITRVTGDIRIRGWAEPTIVLDSDTAPQEVYEESGTLTITGCQDDLRLRVPIDSTISITQASGAVAIKNVRRVELTEIGDEVELSQITEAVELNNLAEDLEVAHTPALLARQGIQGDATLTHVERAEIEAVSGDLVIEHGGTIVVGTVGGDLDAERLASGLRVGTVNGDCELISCHSAEITLSSVGGDLEIDGARRIHVSTVAGDCDLRTVQEEVQVVRIGGGASCHDIGGALQVGDVGADAEFTAVQGPVTAGRIAGDLELQAAFPVDSQSRLDVRGDAEIILPNGADLTLQATVNGEISGPGVAARDAGNRIKLVYGQGQARLELTVGGDLDLQAASHPHHSRVSGRWGEFERELDDFGREMGKFGQELGREMGKLGQELGREFATLFAGQQPGTATPDAPWRDWTARGARKAEKHARRFKRKAEERARRHKRAHERWRGHDPRVRVRLNEREWLFDPERLERIKEQAQRAATEGLSDALEAVERAISKLRVTPPPPPHPSGKPAHPPHPPHPPAPDAAPHAPATGPTIHLSPSQSSASSESTPPVVDTLPSDQEPTPPPTTDKPTLNPEQDREAILRLVAEGRITPEEGDLLLEALDS